MNGSTRKMQLLRTLIDHPRTSEEEREAARRMLARLAAKYADEGVTGRPDSRWYGAKYDHDHRLSTVDIAKLIRQDIKMARKVARMMATPGAVAVADPIADAPAGIKFSVRSQYFAGGSSIDVHICGIPHAWGWETREDHYGYMTEMPTSALAALAKEVRSIMDAYNHDGSDSQADHFDVRFYGSVFNEGGRVLA
jgi:hypothetical protein